MDDNDRSPHTALVYDVGANNGDDSAYYLTKGCRVVAIDANPDMCACLRDRFRPEIEQGRMIVINVGVSDVSGELEFHVNRSRPAISTFEKERFDEFDWVPDDWHTVRVPVVPLSEIIDKRGAPYFIKVDVEYYDRKVLFDLLVNRVRPPFISAEAHEIDVYCLLVAMGYTRFRLVSGATVDKEFAGSNIRTLDGVTRPFHFEYDTSGPFGDDLDQEWVDKNDALERLLSHGLGWVDLHARD